MNKLRLASLAERLKVLAAELENEVKADVGKYVMSQEDYAEVLKYEEINDDDGYEGL